MVVVGGCVLVVGCCRLLRPSCRLSLVVVGGCVLVVGCCCWLLLPDSCTLRCLPLRRPQHPLNGMLRPPVPPPAPARGGGRVRVAGCRRLLSVVVGCRVLAVGVCVFARNGSAPQDPNHTLQQPIHKRSSVAGSLETGAHRRILITRYSNRFAICERSSVPVVYRHRQSPPLPTQPNPNPVGTPSPGARVVLRGV